MKHELVRAGAAGEDVLALAAQQRVVAAIAGEDVGRSVADQHVIAAAAGGILDHDAVGDGEAALDLGRIELAGQVDAGTTPRRRRSAV